MKVNSTSKSNGNVCKHRSGFGSFIVIVAIAVLFLVHAILLHRQNKLLETRNQISNQRLFSTILNNLKTSDCTGTTVAMCQLSSFPDQGDYIDKTLLNLIDSSDNYTVLKAAIYSLIQRQTCEHQKLIKAFWRLCKIAKQLEYDKDLELRAIYNGIEYHAIAALQAYLRDAIDGKIPSIGEATIEEIKKRYNLQEDRLESIDLASKGDYADVEYDHEYEASIYLPRLANISRQLIELSNWDVYFGRDQAKNYEKSFDIFEVVTYLTMVLRDKVALSGVYSRYSPAIINLHLILYRLLWELTIIPDFYSGTERLMYINVNDDDIESFKETWKVLYENDPLMGGHGFSGLLFTINSKGFVYNKRIIKIIYSDRSSTNVHNMFCSLMKQHSRSSVELIDVKEFHDLIMHISDSSTAGFSTDIDWLGLVLFVTFEKSALTEINAALQGPAGIWEYDKQYINLLSFLSLEEKKDFKASKLVLAPKRIIWYDAKNPFDKNFSDIYDDLQKEFGDFVLQKGGWDR
jgi:hypothetical protein